MSDQNQEISKKTKLQISQGCLYEKENRIPFAH